MYIYVYICICICHDKAPTCLSYLFAGFLFVMTIANVSSKSFGSLVIMIMKIQKPHTLII